MRTILTEINDFLAAYPQVSQTTIGKAALRDSYFVSQLRSGREPRTKTVEKVRAWMNAYIQAEQPKTRALVEARKRMEGDASKAIGSG